MLNFCIKTGEKKVRLYISTNEEFITKLYYTSMLSLFLIRPVLSLYVHIIIFQFQVL